MHSQPPITPRFPALRGFLVGPPPGASLLWQEAWVGGYTAGAHVSRPREDVYHRNTNPICILRSAYAGKVWTFPRGRPRRTPVVRGEVMQKPLPTSGE